jgi:hypothetical protein
MPERETVAAAGEGQADLEIEAITSESEDERAGPTRYELLTYPADFTLEVLNDKFAKEEIRVPAIQRGFVWNQPQASRLIESFLLGLPVPPIYLYSERGTEQLLVVDGQQRLKSIHYFFSGLFGEEERGRRNVFRLVLDEKSLFNGKTMADLDEEHQRRLKNSVLRAFIMKQVSPDDNTSIYHVFQRLNTGGTLLTTQEVRNCIYDGHFNTLLLKLNNLPSWRAILGRQNLDKRLKDIELILRFLALFYSGDEYEKPMKDFLSDFMGAHRSGEKNVEFERAFTAVSDSVEESLGDKPFHLRAGLNAAAFDAVFVAFGRNLGAVPADIFDRYQSLKNDEDFLAFTASATTDVDTVRRRLALANERLFG